ncbi:hypothetical protein SAMN05421508_12218 [Caenispirillum bisanense]|uniref:Uncharacterized protein n=1 Tax=Caenispirillum bisanense TaxID=414052 RepID=A0A286H1U5_9PROT|nr:hypothetical protein SAMN05421508_12218 [Caenispirillum bisanense]
MKPRRPDWGLALGWALVAGGAALALAGLVQA